MIVTGSVRGAMRGMRVAEPDKPDIIGVGARPDRSGLYIAALSFQKPTTAKIVTLTLIEQIEPRIKRAVRVAWPREYRPDVGPCPQCDDKGCKACNGKGKTYLHTSYREVTLEYR